MKHTKTLTSTKAGSSEVRSSRIQVEVREIPVVKKQSIVSRHDVDGDSGDISNE